MAHDVQQLAEDFIALCQEGKFDEAGAKYWADDVVSLEPGEGDMARCEGRAAVKAKGDWWEGAHEVHDVSAGDPITIALTSTLAK